MAAESASALQLPVTTPWSQPGTYLAVSGLTLGRLQLRVEAGAYGAGLTATILATGERLVPHQSLDDGLGSFVSLDGSGHTLTVRHPLLNFQLVNADRFFDIEQAQLHSELAATELDGLLGQSADSAWQPAAPGVKTGKAVDPEAQDLVMDYWVGVGQAALFKNEFVTKKFVGV